MQHLPGVNADLIADTRHLVLQSIPALEPFSTDTLIHGDLHQWNLLVRADHLADLELVGIPHRITISTMDRLLLPHL